MTPTQRAAMERALVALEGIQRYGLDTLSSRADGPDDREWWRTGVNEMNKRARLAIAPLRAALEEPAPAQEPIGWYWEYNGRPEGKVFFANPPDQDVIERGLSTEFPCIVRYVYTSPPAQQLEGGPPGSGGWESYTKALEQECSHWRTRAQTMCEHQSGEVWYWQGDGGDHIESMCNSLPVVIRADQLRQMLTSPQPAPVREPVASAWDEGYRAGINDERMSEANIGIAGFNAKIEPTRNNPYRGNTAQQPAPVQEPASHQYQDKDGKWCDFMNEQHFQNTVKDGRWPIRALYTVPPAQQPALTADVPMLTENEFDEILGKHFNNIGAALQAVEKLVRQKAGLK